jgi:molybdenum cofactor cytidylyltransferase
MKISALLLSAGESKRFGENKLLTNIDNKTIIEKSLDSLILQQKSLNEIIVVIGNDYTKILKTISNKKLPQVKVVLNKNYRKGIASSIIKGIENTSTDTEVCIIALADMPFIKPETIKILINEIEKGRYGIITLIYKNRKGHPIAFSKKYFNELKRLKGDIGGRNIVEKYKKDVLEIEVDDEGIIIDIDTKEDYKFAVKKLKNS